MFLIIQGEIFFSSSFSREIFYMFSVLFFKGEDGDLSAKADKGMRGPDGLDGNPTYSSF